MKKTILTYGLISGAFAALTMSITVPFEDKIGFNHSLFLGYTMIVLSLMMVFFGIRSYRDNVGNGQITFVKGFTIGISITLIMCVCYVVTWEIIYFNFMHDYLDKYSAHMVEKARAAGASAAAIQAQVEEMRQLKVKYENPLFNAAYTFIEPFPVGLLMTLISAAILRKKPQTQTEPSALSTVS
jgi:Protein of unknown function (DUF4199)